MFWTQMITNSQSDEGEGRKTNKSTWKVFFWEMCAKCLPEPSWFENRPCFFQDLPARTRFVVLILKKKTVKGGYYPSIHLASPSIPPLMHTHSLPPPPLSLSLTFQSIVNSMWCLFDLVHECLCFILGCLVLERGQDHVVVVLNLIHMNRDLIHHLCQLIDLWHTHTTVIIIVCVCIKFNAWDIHASTNV